MNRACRLAAGAAAVLVLAGCGGTHQQQPPTGPLAAAADQRAAKAVAATDPEMTCTAETFGIAPAGAKTIDEVATVYAWVYCRSKDGVTGEAVPAAVGRDGTARIPRDSDFSSDLDRIFPADVRDRATGGPPADLTHSP